MLNTTIEFKSCWFYCCLWRTYRFLATFGILWVIGWNYQRPFFKFLIDRKFTGWNHTIHPGKLNIENRHWAPFSTKHFDVFHHFLFEATALVLDTQSFSKQIFLDLLLRYSPTYPSASVELRCKARRDEFWHLYEVFQNSWRCSLYSTGNLCQSISVETV